MADPVAEFEQELEVLRTEAEAAAQFFYSYLTIHAVAGDHRPVYRLLDGSALFWNYVPKAADFRRLRAYVHKQRKIYNDKYSDPRRKVFAHKELTDPAAVSALFARTNIRELQRLLIFFSRLYDALWQLFFNGRRPTLRPRRYSLKRMRDRPSPPEIGKSVQERIAREAEQFLMAAASAAQQRIAGDAPQAARA